MDKILQKLRKHFSECMIDHKMIQKDDRILVGLSGGKDSWGLLHLLADLRERAPFRFELQAVTIDGGLLGLNPGELEQGCKELNVPFHIERQRIFETVAEKKEEGSTFCSMCSKLRRGAIYTVAEKLGCTKIALGHHLDDALETLLLNLFYGGRLAALPPVLISNAGHVPVIRPLLYCAESDLSQYAKEKQFRIIGCACPVCPTHPDHEFSDLKRHQIKTWITQISLQIPDLRNSARTALRNLQLDRFFTSAFQKDLEMRTDTHSFVRLATVSVL